MAAGVALAMLGAGCSKPAPPASGSTVSVGVYRVTAQPYTLTATLPGRTTAYQTSEVRPQIEGIIQKRLFTEGSDVSAGQLLYQINPARYQAAYDEAKARLAQARAEVQSARPLAQRYQALAKIDAISSQDKDNAVAQLAADEAAVQTAKATLETARINLDFTKIRAPIAGRIGASAFTPGALVTTNQDKALATIHQLDPIYVDIQQTSTQYIQLRNALRSGQLKTVGPKEAQVMVAPAGSSDAGVKGRLEFAGVSVDPDTGTVQLRAIVPNPQHDLLPGMYVNATLSQGIDVKAILIPQQAVTRDATGQAYCLIVDANNTVSRRNIQIADAANGNRWRVNQGLSAGDRIIVEGTDKAKIGTTVDPVAVTVDKAGNAEPLADAVDATPPSA